MSQIILIFLGGGFGSLARYGVGKIFLKWQPMFPLGTLAANIFACFIIGLITGWAALKPLDSTASYRAFIAFGFCGGFCTFSTFTTDTIQLIMNNRIFDAFINIGLNLFLGLAAAAIGIWLGK